MLKRSWIVQRERRLLGWSGDDSSGDWDTRYRSRGIHDARGSGSVVGFLGLIIADLFLSFSWTWGMHHAYAVAGNRPGPKAVIYVAGRFLVAHLTDLAGGGPTNNPLTALAQTSSATGGCYGVFATSLFRIPAQVVGATTGIQMFAKAVPGYTPDPFLQVDIYLGAVVQGILAFVMVIVNINLTATGVTFFANTFIFTMTRIVLNQLAAGLTNGWLNPASAFGWAYHYGMHTRKDFIVVYWIAPILAALFGVQLYESFVQREGSGNKWKSD